MRRVLRRMLCATALGSLIAASGAGAATSLDQLFVSPAAPVQLDVGNTLLNVQDRHVVAYSATGSALADLGPIPAGVGIEAFHVDAAGARYFAVDVPTPLGGFFVETRDVVRWNGTSYTKHFDGTARGVPAGVAIDAFAMDGSADLLSFDVPFTIGGVTIQPGDLVRWGTPPVLRFDASASGVSDALDLDAAALLSNGHLLLSFDRSGSLPGAGSFRASDALEFDPTTGIWQHNVVGTDFDPGWTNVNLDALHAVFGLAHVGVPAPAIVRALAIDPDAPPRTYELRLDCGAHRIARLGAGILLSPNVAADSVSVGDCTVSSCNGASGFGPTIDGDALVVDFPPGTGGQRSDAIYVDLPGAPPSGLVCTPGQDVLLATLTIRGGTGTLPVPGLTSEGAPPTLRETVALLDPEHLGFESGALDPDYEIRVRPTLGDTTGRSFEVLIRGRIRLHQLGVALLPPAGVGAGLTFGGCITPAGANNTRSCEGSRQLGPHVDPRLSSTIGPAASLLPLGGHPNAIYLRLTGATRVFGTHPALDLPGSELRWTELGKVLYAAGTAGGPPSVLIAGLGPLDGVLPPITDEFLGEVFPTAGGSGGSRGGEGSDYGDDGHPDDGPDVCVGSPSNQDSGGLGVQSPPDGIGDDCQCGDVLPDGFVEQAGDVTKIRNALTGAVALSANDALKCSVEGALDSTPSGVGLRKDCSIADVVVLRRLLAGELALGQQGTPLADPSAVQACGAP